MIEVEDNTGASTNPAYNKIALPELPDVDRSTSVITPGEIHSYFPLGVTDDESGVDAASPSEKR